LSSSMPAKLGEGRPWASERRVVIAQPYNAALQAAAEFLRDAEAVGRAWARQQNTAGVCNGAMRLFDFLFSGNGYKVRFLLRALGLPFTYQEIDILRGDSRAPWFLVKNPFGQIPVLELPDGTCLRESSAILMYLSEGTHLLPEDRLLRARVLEWLCFEQTHVDGVISRARFRRIYPHVIPTREEEFAVWHADGHRALAVLDGHLARHAFLVDGRFSVADIACFAYTHCAEQGGFDLAGYAALDAWFARVRQEPGYLPIDETPTDELISS
jgi:glutathione S-transferase